MGLEKKEMEEVFEEKGFDDFKWIDPGEIIIKQWVRIKCQSCPDYGEVSFCPPNVPSVDDCREFFKEYDEAVVFHVEEELEDPADHADWCDEVNQGLLEIENELFRKGYPKAYLFFMMACTHCSDCVGDPTRCRYPKKSRPSIESMAVDVFNTVKKLDYSIDTLQSYKDKMNRYAFLMIE